MPHRQWLVRSERLEEDGAGKARGTSRQERCTKERDVRSAVLGLPPRLSGSHILIIRVRALAAALIGGLGLGRGEDVGIDIANRQTMLGREPGRVLVWRRRRAWEGLLGVVLGIVLEALWELVVLLRQAIGELVVDILINDCVSPRFRTSHATSKAQKRRIGTLNAQFRRVKKNKKIKRGI